MLIEKGSLNPSGIKTLIPSVIFVILSKVLLLFIIIFNSSLNPSLFGTIFPLFKYNDYTISICPLCKSGKSSLIEESISLGI